MLHDNTQDTLRSRLADSSDRRVQRTRALLFEAYRALRDDDGAPITVSAVVERAGVTRSSFYTHFRGVEELAAATLTDYMDALVETARASVISGESKREVSHSVFLKLSRFLGAHRDTYGAMLVEGGAFAKSLAQAMVELNLGTLRTRDELYGHPDVTAQFFAGGVITVLSWWLRTEPAMSPEALAQALIDVTPRDFKD